jgi:pre-rRNA-processing protein IPI1
VKIWFEGLGKALWEIGVKDAYASERILRFLLIVGQRGERGFEKPYSLVDSTVSMNLSSILV